MNDITLEKILAALNSKKAKEYKNFSFTVTEGKVVTCYKVCYSLITDVRKSPTSDYPDKKRRITIGVSVCLYETDCRGNNEKEIYCANAANYSVGLYKSWLLNDYKFDRKAAKKSVLNNLMSKIKSANNRPSK